MPAINQNSPIFLWVIILKDQSEKTEAAACFANVILATLVLLHASKFEPVNVKSYKQTNVLWDKMFCYTNKTRHHDTFDYK